MTATVVTMPVCIEQPCETEKLLPELRPWKLWHKADTCYCVGPTRLHGTHNNGREYYICTRCGKRVK